MIIALGLQNQLKHHNYTLQRCKLCMTLCSYRDTFLANKIQHDTVENINAVE